MPINKQSSNIFKFYLLVIFLYEKNLISSILEY